MDDDEGDKNDDGGMPFISIAGFGLRYVIGNILLYFRDASERIVRSIGRAWNEFMGYDTAQRLRPDHDNLGRYRESGRGLFSTTSLTSEDWEYMPLKGNVPEGE